MSEIKKLYEAHLSEYEYGSLPMEEHRNDEKEDNYLYVTLRCGDDRTEFYYICESKLPSYIHRLLFPPENQNKDDEKKDDEKKEEQNDDDDDKNDDENDNEATRLDNLYLLSFFWSQRGANRYKLKKSGMRFTKPTTAIYLEFDPSVAPDLPVKPHSQKKHEAS